LVSWKLFWVSGRKLLPVYKNLANHDIMIRLMLHIEDGIASIMSKVYKIYKFTIGESGTFPCVVYSIREDLKISLKKGCITIEEVQIDIYCNITSDGERSEADLSMIQASLPC
jgi:hypothetical protein